MSKKIELLEKIELFHDLSDSELAILANCSEIVPFIKECVVFRNGERSNSFFIVNSGEVRIVSIDENEKEQLLAQFLPGEIFGEFDLFENDPRTATAITSEETRLLVFPKNGLKFGILYKKYPVIFVKIYRKLISINAGRIRQTNNIVSEKSSWINELKEQMLKDKLTGFYNKTYLTDEFPSVLKQLDQLCVAVVKPDDFKAVNDTFGHEAGDTALKIISLKVLEQCGDMDIVVRFRGNEFMVIYCNNSIEGAGPQVEDLHKQLEAVDIGKQIAGTSLQLTYSIGLAEFPLHADDFDTLVQLAYAQMFEQRDSGGSGIKIAQGGNVDIVPFLQTVTIFSSLYISQLQIIASYLKPLTVAKDDYICKQGDMGDELFLIESGSATAAIIVNGEEEKIITTFEPGDFFGEMAIFDNAERSATCRAVEDTTLYFLSKNDFMVLMDDDPVIAIKIMQQMLDVTSLRLSKTGKFIAEMVKWGNNASKRAITDELTGVYNRRYLDSSLEKHFHIASQNQKPLALIMADLDFFREVNEGYDHATGDRYIVEVADVFRQCLRDHDIVARYGGDEFTILLPETPLDKAQELAESIRSKVEKLNFLKDKDGPDLALSVSLGLAVFPEHCTTKELLSSYADEALYKAKESGRNRVFVYGK